MKKTGLVIDSTAYLEREYIARKGIKVVPLAVELDGVEEVEGFPGSFDKYFERLELSRSFPTTSQPAVGEFQQAYEQLFQAGADRILVLTFSSGLSGTHNSAKLASGAFEDREILVVDTLSAAGVFSYMVRRSVEMIDECQELSEIAEEIESIRNRSNIDLTVESLDYLKRGGRLTNIQAMLAGMLNIKPVISLEDGRLVGNGKYRGKKKALKEMIGRIPEDPVNIGLHYVRFSDEVELLKGELEKKYPDVDIVLEELGPVIGSHLGPNSIGICTVSK